MIEIWKDIIGYEGLYQISNLGRVKSLTQNKLLKPQFIQRYLLVKLYRDKKPRMFRMHRLVAQHFIDNKNNLPIVMHKDNNTRNNSVNNLQWGTQQDNIRQSSAENRIFDVSKPVLQFDKDNNFIKEYSGATHANKELNILTTSINNCLRNKSKTAGGYIWKYKKINL